MDSNNIDLTSVENIVYTVTVPLRRPSDCYGGTLCTAATSFHEFDASPYLEEPYTRLLHE